MESNEKHNFKEVIDAFLTDRKAEYFIDYIKNNHFEDDELSGLKLFLENNAYDLKLLKDFFLPPAIHVIPPTCGSCFKSIKIAASVLLLISLTILANYYYTSKNNIDNYWVQDEGFKVLMGGENQAISLLNGMSYYVSENYEESLRVFSTVPKNDTASFYIGLCFLKLNEVDSALKHLKRLPASSVYKNKSTYYLALSYLANNEKDTAIALLKTCHFENKEMEAKRTMLLLEHANK
jgi:tetratricopeptide (TPR) repeat protein